LELERCDDGELRRLWIPSPVRRVSRVNIRARKARGGVRMLCVCLLPFVPGCGELKQFVSDSLRGLCAGALRTEKMFAPVRKARTREIRCYNRHVSQRESVTAVSKRVSLSALPRAPVRTRRTCADARVVDAAVLRGRLYVEQHNCHHGRNAAALLSNVCAHEHRLNSKRASEQRRVH
jgi:hypothetical protein